MRMTSLLLLLFLLSAANPAEAARARVMHEDHVWHAKPTASQVPGSASFHSGSHDPFGLWFNTQLSQATFQTPMGIDSVRLHCGLAGQNGPLLWTTGSSPIDVEDGRNLHRIGTVDLGVQAPTGPCPVRISDVASLKQAAKHRLLYVEYERNGELVRGQFWPKKLAARDWWLINYVSADQVPGAVDDSLAERIDAAYILLREHTRNMDALYLGYSNKSPEDIYYGDGILRCGPPGTDGELIARGSEFYLYMTNAHLYPTDGTGTCGMVITTVASVVEALLRGWIYIELTEPGSDRPLRRGQFASPLD